MAKVKGAATRTSVTMSATTLHVLAEMTIVPVVNCLPAEETIANRIRTTAVVATMMIIVVVVVRGLLAMVDVTQVTTDAEVRVHTGAMLLRQNLTSLVDTEGTFRTFNSSFCKKSIETLSVGLSDRSST